MRPGTRRRVRGFPNLNHGTLFFSLSNFQDWGIKQGEISREVANGYTPYVSEDESDEKRWASRWKVDSNLACLPA